MNYLPDVRRAGQRAALLFLSIMLPALATAGSPSSKALVMTHDDPQL
jgi:hypothetical protein